MMSGCKWTTSRICELECLQEQIERGKQMLARVYDSDPIVHEVSMLLKVFLIPSRW